MRFWFLLLVLVLMLTTWIGCECGNGDDDSGDDDTGDDDNGDDDDDNDDSSPPSPTTVDPFDYIDEAWQLALDALSETPDQFTLFQIDGSVTPASGDLSEKEILWKYSFWASFDQDDTEALVEVEAYPVKSATITCEAQECPVLGRVFLQREEWNDATVSLEQMFAISEPALGDQDVDFISLFEDLNPAYGFIGWYLQKGINVVLLINAETGDIVPD
ncbi:MAG: hypothetical protein P9L99_02495 [Candidatus Lernaella stagnicola]|nr:hypothetical protein [Candidatus Lernaella stagnicola]